MTTGRINQVIVTIYCYIAVFYHNNKTIHNNKKAKCKSNNQMLIKAQLIFVLLSASFITKSNNW